VPVKERHLPRYSQPACGAVSHAVRVQTLEQDRPADYLTRLAASDLGRSYKSLVVDEMKINAGQVVLDLGCGPGTDLGAFAAAVGPAGRVVGIDSDPAAVSPARRLVSDWPQTTVEVADAHALPLSAGSVDRVHTDRVLQHVDNPASVIAEVARVLRPSGVAAFAEPDWDTLVVDYPDLAVAEAYRRFVVEHAVRNAHAGRQLPALCEHQRLTAPRVIPVTAVFRDVTQADRILGFKRVTDRTVAAGYLSSRQADQWLTHLRTGPFFASVTLFVTLAGKPPG
jgi:ubiquinone/menaquinone biosynthesis C-methylase UbiE